ncbi:sulfatase-like hydrolase/transferase [Flavobacterium sp. LMO8]|uniref:sulfatase n=1 Tax=Flavobacterium sp. LMO8 TaxID=2654244 RepID=UPI001290DB47|nr:sulfatase [Flavobacterium sp. LMO8]MQP25660.1 sulfatase-like hydrolase/transferase [Flavobacterium sp. LMO8]
MRTNLIKSSLLLVLIALSIGVNAQEKKPNILFVIVDDWGFKDMSGHGSQIYQTPNVDKLAKEGLDFQNAYSSYPRCVPSRYAIMTGTYPVNEDHGNLGAIKEDKNFIKKFNKAGYNSFYVGKWHLGTEESSPKGYGFKESFAAGDAGGTDTHFYPYNLKRVAGTKGEKAPIEDVQAYAKEGEFLSDALTRRTIDYMKDNKSKPFIGVLAFYAVHTPIEAKPEDVERNKKQIDAFDYGTTPEYVTEGNGVTRMRQNEPTYAGLVENTDENIGRLIQALKENGLYENTIIVLTSDHGGLSTKGKNNRIIPTSNAPFRAGKGWMYEGGIKVPLLVHYPKEIKAKVDTESVVLGMDVFPTLVDYVLQERVNGIDGKSFKNVIKGKEKWTDRTVYWNSYKARPTQTGDDKTSVIRIGDFKLLQFVESNKLELYNVKEDISEKNDLSAKMPEKVKEMLAQLEKWKSDSKIVMKANHKSGGEEVSLKKQAKKDAKKAERKAAKKAEKQ